MPISIVGKLNPDLSRKGAILGRFSQYLKTEFKDLSLADDIKGIIIEVVCLEPKFEPFFELKPPQRSGEIFEFSVTLDYAEAKRLDDDEFVLYLKRALKSSLVIVEDNIGNGMKDFNEFSKQFGVAVDKFQV